MIFEEFMLRVKYQTFMECVQNHYKLYHDKLTMVPKLIPDKAQQRLDLYLDVNGQFDQFKFDKPEELKHESDHL